MDIILGRANANKQLVRSSRRLSPATVLASCTSKGAQLAMRSLAKPSRSVTIPEAEADGLWEFASDFLDTLQTE